MSDLHQALQKVWQREPVDLDVLCGCQTVQSGGDGTGGIRSASATSEACLL